MCDAQRGYGECDCGSEKKGAEDRDYSPGPDYSPDPDSPEGEAHRHQFLVKAMAGGFSFLFAFLLFLLKFVLDQDTAHYILNIFGLGFLIPKRTPCELLKMKLKQRLQEARKRSGDAE